MRWCFSASRARIDEHGGGVDARAIAVLDQLLAYVKGEYSDERTFVALRAALGGAKRPAYYLAIPPLLFGSVVEHLSAPDRGEGARVFASIIIWGSAPSTT